MQVSEQIVAETAQRVLESMAFTFVTPGADDEHVYAECVRATIRFDGPFRGCVVFTLPADIVPEMVTNMLGDDDAQPHSAQQQHDAIGELANVMCGNLVQAIAGPQPVFKLDTPRVAAGPIETLPIASGVKTVTARVPLDVGWAELSIVLETELPDQPASATSFSQRG